MPILRKLKSLLGADDADEESERDVTVTVEHDPENEAAVKGAEVDEPEADVDEEAEGVADTDEETDDESASDETVDADEPVEIPDAEGGTADAESTVDADGDEVEADDATDAQPEADAGAADDTGSDEPVDVLNGIGPAYAERLENAGIETVGDLAAADAATLADDADIAEGRIQGWIDQASDY